MKNFFLIFKTKYRNIGTGNIDGVKALLPYFGGAEKAIQLRAHGDNSTILHWSVSGAKRNE